MANEPLFPACLSTHLPAGEATERLGEELTEFLVRRLGVPVEEVAGRRIACLPLDRFSPELAWSFVADHLITQVSLPVRKLEGLAELLSRGIRAMARKHEIATESSRAIVPSLQKATGELRRLDTLSRGLRALPSAGRPGRDLYDRDPVAYAQAMWQWENEQPSATDELEGGFSIVSIEDGKIEVRHHGDGSDSIPLEIPHTLVQLCRTGDRIDALLGKSRYGWFIMDAFAVAAPAPPIP